MKTKLLILLFLASLSIYAQTNLVPNANFETWTSSSQPDNWFRYFSGFASQSASAQNGTSSTNMMIASGTFNYINSEYFPVVANKTYRITLYHKLVSGSFSAIDLSLYHKPGSFKEEIIKKTDATVSSSEWRKIEFDYTPTVSENIEVDIWTTGTLNSEILVDNVSVIDVATIGAQYTLIPDVNFENKLIALGIDSGVADGKVLTNSVNKITSLNVSSSSITDLTGIQDFVNLISLSCSYNQCTTLDVSKNVVLTNLICSSNKLTTLDVSKNLVMSYLNCSDNQLIILDVSKNAALSSLDCSYSKQLTNLDVSKNIALTKLNCSNNVSLQEINLKNSKNTLIKSNDLILTKNTSLTCILVDNIAFSDTNWNASKDSTVDFTDTQCSTPQYTLIPDINFEKALIILGIDGIEDGKVLTNRVANVTNLDLGNYYTNLNTTDLTGIQDFTSLEVLKLPNNQNGNVTNLDVSKNIKLKVLICDYNKLSTLDVSKNLALTELSCYYNKLTNLDVSKNLALNKLDCSLNRLTNLDVSKNLALTNLSCGGSNKEGSFNKEQGLLTNIDLSQNIALEYLRFDFNNKVKLDVSKNKNLLSINVDNNSLTTIDFSANTLLKNLSCESNNLTNLDVSKYTALESLDCSYNLIKSLDVSQKPTLKNLAFASNLLTSINLSQNSALETLYCSSNQLTSLDLSMNPNLKQVICNNNNLTKLNLKNGNNVKIVSTNYSNFRNNPYLSCITVDNVSYSDANWAKFKDLTQNYNTECNFSLPSNNFNVESKGETCPGSNNGEINIVAAAPFTYKTSIDGASYTFTNNSLKVPNLTPGTYTVSITIPGENFEQIFTIAIPKGATITGKSSVAANKVSVEITEGTAPYTVFVDGVEQFETTDTNFTVATKKGGLLQVKTAKACEGIYAKDIARLDEAISAYPNPTSGSFEIELPTSKKEVVITLYTLDGQMISTKTYTVENGKAQLSLENQPTGVYVAKIELDTPDYLKIIKN